MYALLLFVLLSSSLILNFRLFDRWGLNRVYIIVINYMVCLTLGLAFLPGGTAALRSAAEKQWLPWALGLGGLFLLNFFFTGKTVARFGASLASVAGKMSLVLPFLFTGIRHGIQGNPLLACIGLLLCVIGIVWVSDRNHSGQDFASARPFLYLPVVVFLGSGITDTLSGYCNETFVQAHEKPVFTWFVFLGAFLGSLALLATEIFRNGFVWNKRLPLAGIMLGLPNYGSYRSLLQALAEFGHRGDVVFPVANVAIILFTSVVAFWGFGDPYSRKNLFGIAFSVLSLLLIFSQFWL